MNVTSVMPIRPNIAFKYGDPEQPDSMGVKGLLDDHGRRIKGIERRNKAVVGFAGAAGLAALTAWLEHFFGTRP